MTVTIHYWEAMRNEDGISTYPHVSLSTSEHYISLHQVAQTDTARLVRDASELSTQNPTKVIQFNIDEKKVNSAIKKFLDNFNQGEIPWLTHGRAFSQREAGYNAFSLTLWPLWIGGAFDHIQNSATLSTALYLEKIANIATCHHFCQICNVALSPETFLDLLSQKPLFNGLLKKYPRHI